MPYTQHQTQNTAVGTASFEPGDLLLFYGRDLTSRIIELVTRGPSHIGICLPIYRRGLLLIESTTLCDLTDVISNRKKSGVQQPEA